MPIPTEPIGSIPRTPELIRAFTVKDCDDPSLAPVYEAAIRDTVARFEAAGSPIVPDGEQRKFHNFWDTAFEKIRARVLGTARAAEFPGVV